LHPLSGNKLVEGFEEIVFRFGSEGVEGGEISRKKYLDFFWKEGIE